MIRAAILWLALATPLGAAGFPDGVPGAEVGRIVRAALAEAGQLAEMPDPLRPFPACNSAPMAAPRAGHWATVELTCPAPRWSRALRTGIGPAVAPAASAAPAPQAVTLALSLPKGAVVTEADLTLADAAGHSADQTFRSTAEVIGRRLKAALGAGKPLLQRHLEPLWLVEAGAPLVLVAMAGGLEVSAPAEAMDSGALGDVVRVLNRASGREVKAVVTGPNRVAAQTNIR